uniref:Uncharacterized protein n=1 Tax=Candidozyma auris TaxID=498019 RepID=A0A0L0NVN5_CANAR
MATLPVIRTLVQILPLALATLNLTPNLRALARVQTPRAMLILNPAPVPDLMTRMMMMKSP